MRLPLVLLLVCSWPAFGQFKSENAIGEAPGSWICGTIGVGKQSDGTITTTALKGIAIRLGEQGDAAVAYDLELCRMAGAWTGKFVTPMNLMSRGEYPTAMGDIAFTSSDVAGWNLQPTTAAVDSRKEPFGPLPTGEVQFKGFHVFKEKVILQWDLNGNQVLEMPDFEKSAGVGYFTRTFNLGPTQGPVSINVGNASAPLGVAVMCSDSKDVGVSEIGQQWRVVVPKLDRPIRFKVIAGRQGAEDLQAWTRRAQAAVSAAADLSASLKGGPARWPETLVTEGELSTDKESAYVVDTIKLPEANPWKAPMFVGGFDFFADGRIAFCTFHGDVWIGSGLDQGLQKVTWKRFATGLYHALGLRIVRDQIYVTGRDGITRLSDLNQDGEADWYEAFNHDVLVTKSFHEFVFDLQSDPAGNFYFAKAGPVKNGGRGFDQIVAHHGCLLRVSADGKKLETVATGFRAPNGIGCGPDGQLTSGDNEGTWTPVCKINWIKPGGFYGVVDLAHRDPAPTDYDRPLCWLPKRVDNSGGGQVWVDSERWGPWKGQLLHLSYGTCSLFGVLKEKVDGFEQGGVTQFPLKFQSGIMRARFNPADGQLYVGGLRGWQTTGLKNGCLQRVRYTGAPTRMPMGLAVKKDGIELSFSSDLDSKSAADPENYQIEVWNYVWSSAYGSPEISTQGEIVRPGEPGKSGALEFSKAQMGKPQHDALEVKSATVSTDEKKVFLEIPGLKPVMQMSVKYSIKSAAGTEMRGEVLNTIHALGK